MKINNEIMEQYNDFEYWAQDASKYNLDSENELKWTDEIMEKEIEWITDFVDVYSKLDSTSGIVSMCKREGKDTSILCDKKFKKQQEADSCSGLDGKTDNSSSSYSIGNLNRTSSEDTKRFLAPLRTSKKSNPSISTFVLPREPRSKYLLRFPKLFEKCLNSGDLFKLKVLFKDILTVDSRILVQMLKLESVVTGREKFFQLLCSMMQNIPDFCVMFSDITRKRRGLIEMVQKGFGTFPYANIHDETRTTWNFFETTPIEKLDEHHQIQKRKYDLLKSQGRQIQFETNLTLHLKLDRAAKCVTKLVLNNAQVNIG